MYGLRGVNRVDSKRHRQPGAGSVLVSRGTHVLVVDGATGKVLGDIPDTRRTHGIGLAPKSGHGFIADGRDPTAPAARSSPRLPTATA